jgi:hypothetical protein
MKSRQWAAERRNWVGAINSPEHSRAGGPPPKLTTITPM